MITKSTAGWMGAVGLALGLGYVLGQPAAVAQIGAGGMMGGMGMVHVAATSAGGGSQAWAIDARTSQVILCATDVTASKISCKSATLPGSAMR